MGDKKQKKYDDAIAALKARGIKYELRGNDLELVFDNMLQFWPTTGTIMQDGKRLDLKGLDAFLEIIK